MRGLYGIWAAALGLAAALCATAAVAADDPMLSMFKSACFDTHADPQKALTVVDAAGWRVEPLGPDAAKQGLTIRDKWIGKVHWELTLIQKDLPPGDVSFPTVMHTCLVSVSPSDADVHQLMHGLIGAEPFSKDNTNWGWSYFETSGGRNFRPPSDMASRDAGLNSGPLVMLVATAATQGNVLGIVTVAKR